jgi:hypothetical protein
MIFIRSQRRLSKANRLWFAVCAQTKSLVKTTNFVCIAINAALFIA